MPTFDDPGSKRHSGAAPLADLELAVQELVALGMVPIPPYPAIALRLKQEMQRERFGLAEAAQLIRSDAALAADVLRCANSAFYRRGEPVTNVGQAVTRIGAEQLMRLVIAAALATHVHAPGPLAQLRRLVWIESLCGAAVAQELARLRRLRCEEAFLLGLLHDFGKVVACSCLESLVAKRQAIGTWAAEEWAAIVERQHVAVGRLVAARWRLPRLIADVIAAHHGDTSIGCEDPKLLDVIRVSDEVVALLMTHPHVAASNLMALSRIAPSEREPIARILLDLPGLVASFESPAHLAAASPSIAGPDTTLNAFKRGVQFAVTVSVARRARDYTAREIDASGLAMVGSQPLPEDRLLEATLHVGPEPLTLWALSRLSTPEGTCHRVELQPFALTGAARARWFELAKGDA